MKQILAHLLTTGARSNPSDRGVVRGFWAYESISQMKPATRLKQ